MIYKAFVRWLWTKIMSNGSGVFGLKIKNLYLVSLDDSDVSVSETAPESFSILSNFPNPFNLSTSISFTLSAPGFTDLSVYNMAGQCVRKLLSGNLSSGPHTALWNGCDESGKTVSSGVYFSVLKSGGKTATGKMALVK